MDEYTINIVQTENSFYDIEMDFSKNGQKRKDMSLNGNIPDLDNFYLQVKESLNYFPFEVKPNSRIKIISNPEEIFYSKNEGTSLKPQELKKIKKTLNSKFNSFKFV